MSDDDDDDLFADSDSDDTAELVRAASSSSKPKQQGSSPPSKLIKKKVAPKKTEDSDEEDEDDNKEDTGLFDSDSDDSDKPDDRAKAKKSSSPPPMSKRERLEALAKKKNRQTTGAATPPSSTQPNKAASSNKDKTGYESEDTYDSATFERTKEDDDFLDTTGEDPDAVQELYAAQHFDDERPDDYDSKKKSKKRKVNYDGDNSYGNNGSGGGAGDGEGGEKVPDNPIMAAVHRMKKKKRDKKTLTELEEELRLFLGKMELAADQDEQAVREKKPALNKLANLNEMVEMLTRKDSQRLLLDLDVLVVCKRWIQPLPNGQLGNVTVRSRVLEAVGNMTGDTGINPNDLKRSEFGKVVMALYKHKQETLQLKQKLKALIEQWSRPIFQKSGNMRDLERVAGRGDRGLAALARQQQQEQQAQQIHSSGTGRSSFAAEDLHGLIAGGGRKASAETGTTRVRVPYSKGFAFSVRPQGKAAVAESPDPIRRAVTSSGGNDDTRGKLSKRMQEKNRAVGKNQRSANLSIEGRPTK